MDIEFFDQDDHRPSGISSAIAGVTAACDVEVTKSDPLRESSILIQEANHRIANSFQIVARILLQSARNVGSEETRRHLHDAHHRIMAIATLQRYLATYDTGDVQLRPYFIALCANIDASMIFDLCH